VLYRVEKERTFDIQINEARLSGLVTSYVQTAVQHKLLKKSIRDEKAKRKTYAVSD